MTIETIIVMAIWLIASVIYLWCALQAEKSRRYHEKQADKATEVLEQLTKLWGKSKEAQNEEVHR